MSARGIDISPNADLYVLDWSLVVEHPPAHRKILRWNLLIILRYMYIMKAPFEKMETSSLKNI